MSETTHSYPTTMKKLRACFNCHLVKTEQQVNQNYFDVLNYVYLQFLEKGCENCHEDWNRQEAYHNITSNFKGIISITNPKYSWAARWLHKSKNKYFTLILNFS